jgi:hypothetical protein
VEFDRFINTKHIISNYSRYVGRQISSTTYAGSNLNKFSLFLKFHKPVKYIFVDNFVYKGSNDLIKPITLQGIVSVMIHLGKQKLHFCMLNMKCYVFTFYFSISRIY